MAEVKHFILLKLEVKQGAVLSAPFFALYVDDLLINLNNSKQGCHIGYMSANAFGYADDIVILSPSCKALKFLIAICEKYASEYKIQFNPDKCTLLIFSDSDFYHNNVNIIISGCKIKKCKAGEAPRSYFSEFKKYYRF